MKKTNVIVNVASIAVGCLLAGGGVFLLRTGLDLTSGGVLPFLRKAASKCK